MTFAGKWVEPDVSMLSKANHVQKDQAHVLSYAESRPKIYREIYMHIYITMTIIEEISREGDEEERRERKQMMR
jgi:hypothetical protein